MTGKRVLHLQCHFGQDPLSLFRLGAQEVIGIDISPEAIKTARNLAKDLDLNAEFICCNVIDTIENLEGEFDIIFSSYGTIGWIPDLKPWASVIQHFLTPEGKFIFVEFHPFVWTFDDDFTKIKYSYFNDEVISEETTHSYTGQKLPTKMTEHTWNHPLSEVLSCLIQSGLTVKDFQEYKYSPYDCFENTSSNENGFFIKPLQDKLPLVYSLVIV